LRVIERIVEAPYKFLKRYFKRDLSEADSADKRRFGWLIRQKREDRREMLEGRCFLCWTLSQPVCNQ